MSVDTRTPRPGFDDQPPLSMLKVDSDPAQVIVNHASFRVKLASPQRAAVVRTLTDTARIPAMSGAPAAGGARRRAPVVWSGRSEPGDPGATGLLQAVRNSTAARTSAAVRTGGTYEPVPEGGYERHDAGATQVIPRIDLDDDATTLTPVVGGRGGAGGRPGGGRPGPLLPPMRQAVGAYDAPSEDDLSDRELSDRELSGQGLSGQGSYDDLDPDDDRPRAQRHGADTVRHAYYPGRRMNLGVVLLPLRVFLGFISIYAGMGKLCDPVYFDGGERGSMVKWLHSLHPWALAEPLRDFALSHPVGAGLSIAFLQIVVGVLTVLGLWQRVAASFGAVLSAALLLTVSWRTVPAYDAPDIIYLAAWSPLIIAGAPVYSVDGRLAGEAWRRLGPRSEIWDLRRRVLRRGAVLASVVIGLTFLIGSVLGGAVRSSDMVTVPGPNDDPVNQLPGVPLPRESSGRASASGSPSGDGRTSGKPAEPSATRSSAPAARESAPARTPARETASAGSGQNSGQQQPSQTQGTGAAPPRTSEQAPPPPPTSQGPSSSGSTGDGSSGGTGGTDGGSSTTGGSSSGGTGARNPIGGLLG
ncbi:DoxX family protein [Streptomyces sp. SID1121]|uniref:DoxX family protein n=1 Tax=Streptomyces sp. SID1121 TaxID=3425888 RepID=UPI0040563A0B